MGQAAKHARLSRRGPAADKAACTQIIKPATTDHSDGTFAARTALLPINLASLSIQPVRGVIMFGKRVEDADSATHFRAERFSLVNGEVYFSTRENTLEGPYLTREDAEREMAAYVNRVQRLQQRH
jgi:hypothetical protein